MTLISVENEGISFRLYTCDEDRRCETEASLKHMAAGRTAGSPAILSEEPERDNLLTW